MIFVIMFMIVEIKTDTMIVCPPTCYGATVGCAVFYLISNDPRFLTFVQRASIQNKRLALNVRDATDHWTNKQIPIRSNLIQGHKIILFDPNSLPFPNWLINSLHWSHHVMHVNASGCIEAVLLWFYKSHTIDQYYTAWIRLTCELSYCVMRFSQEANIASYSGSGIDFGNVLF